MTPVWIMGSNVDLSNPLMTSADRARKLREELLAKKEEKEQKDEFKEVFTDISDSLKNMLSGLASLFGGSGGTTTNTTGGSTVTTGATINGNTTNTTSLQTSTSSDINDVLNGIDSSIGNTNYTTGIPTTSMLNSGDSRNNVGYKITDKAVAWAVGVANDPRSGYDQAHREGPDYDCSSLVNNAYEKAGIPVKTNGASYTGNMVSVYKNLGFTDVTSETANGTNASTMMPGDVLWRKGHVEMYVGNGKRVGAHIAENGGAIAGQQGDQTGNEISVTNLGNGNWSTVLRAPNTYTDGSVKDILSGLNSSGEGTTYGGGFNLGTGSFIITESEEEKNKREAEEYWKNLREQGYDAIYKSKQNEVEKGSDIVGKTNTNTSSWISDYNDVYENLSSFNNPYKFDKNKSVSGLQSIWDKMKNVDGDVSSSSFKPNSSPTSGSTAKPNSYDDLPAEQTKYYTKLLEVLNLIQKNTSNIPKTNELLNEIIDLIDSAESGKESQSTNIFDSLFGPIEGDINLIASGI